MDSVNICWAPTVCQGRGWQCRGKAVWTGGRVWTHKLGVMSQPREWSDGGTWMDWGAESGEWIKEGFWDEKGIKVRNSRERWGNHKEVRLPEWKSVPICEWWEEADPGDFPAPPGPFNLPHEGCGEPLIDYIFSSRWIILCGGWIGGGDLRWGSADRTTAATGASAGEGMWVVPLGKERGRATEKWILGELSRTCDCWGASEGKGELGATPSRLV